MVSRRAALLASLLSCIVSPSVSIGARQPPLYALYCADAPDAPPFYDSASVLLPTSIVGMMRAVVMLAKPAVQGALLSLPVQQMLGLYLHNERTVAMCKHHAGYALC